MNRKIFSSLTVLCAFFALIISFSACSSSDDESAPPPEGTTELENLAKAKREQIRLKAEKKAEQEAAAEAKKQEEKKAEEQAAAEAANKTQKRESLSDSPNAVQFLAMLHLSGDFAAEGKAMKEGMELALDEAIKKGIPGGVSVNLIVEDTEYDAKEVAGLASKNLLDPSIRGTFISTLHEAKGIAASLEKAQMPTIIIWDSSQEIEDMGNYIFGIGPWTEDAGKKAARFAMKSLDAKKVFVIGTNTDWSNLVSKAFFDYNTKAGVDVMGSVNLNPEDRDFLGILAKVRGSGAEVLYAPLTSNILTFTKQVESSQTTLPIIMSDVINPALIQEARGKLEGYYQTGLADPEGPLVMTMIHSFNEKYGRDPSNIMLTALGYDAMRMFLASMQSTGNTRENIKDGMYKIKEMEGPSGVTSISEKGSSPKYASVFQVVEGKLVLKEKADAGGAQ